MAMKTFYTLHGRVPAIENKREETLPALLLQQIKDQSNLDATHYNSYTFTEGCALAYHDQLLDYRD